MCSLGRDGPTLHALPSAGAAIKENASAPSVGCHRYNLHVIELDMGCTHTLDMDLMAGERDCFRKVLRPRPKTDRSIFLQS